MSWFAKSTLLRADSSGPRILVDRLRATQKARQGGVACRFLPLSALITSSWHGSVTIASSAARTKWNDMRQYR